MKYNEETETGRCGWNWNIAMNEYKKSALEIS